MALRLTHIMGVGLPVLLALLAASWQSQKSADFDVSAFDDTPALQLLQREATVIHMAANSAQVVQAKAARRQPTQPEMATTPAPGVMTTPATSSVDSANLGISANGVGNLPIFLTGMLTDFIILFICFCIFVAGSRRYPLVYFGNTIQYEGTDRSTPKTVDQFMSLGIFNFMKASWALTFDDVWKTAGLDHAQILEFTSLCLKTMTWIALPMFFIQGPLNCFFGGNAAGQDHESWFSMGNVEFYCWLYWPIAIFIWWVTYCVTDMIHKGMREFMPRRFEWLKAMDKLRSNTILMIGIPPEYQSDDACAKFWNDLLPGSVQEVHLTKDTTQEGNLSRLIHDREVLQTALDHNEALWKQDGNDPDKRPTIKLTWAGAREDAIEHYKKEVAEIDPKIKEERDKVLDAASKATGSPNLSTGFITFKERKDAEIALRLDLSHTTSEWQLDYPPQPTDVIWADMTQDPNAEAGRSILGYALTAGLVIIYMPLVVFICNVAQMINMGPLQSIWSAEAPSLGLTIMVDFLPTILMLIFTNCFSLYDKSAAQLKLSVWYWWMNVLYVVLVTALGTNFMQFADTLAHDPLKVFGLLADTMPNCTHYYMNYIGMQFYAHGMVLTRYVPCIKYRNKCRNYTEEEAKKMAEPEDQDYYGIGSRTCRWSTMMCIGIVYGTLSPPCSVLTMMLFAIIRTIYGYLFVYAETVKADLGGIFFVQALNNMFTSLHIYFVLMLGVYAQRSPNWGPVFLVTLGWAYVFYSQHKFLQYKWERLPYPELNAPSKRTVRKLEGSYMQPELRG